MKIYCFTCHKHVETNKVMLDNHNNVLECQDCGTIVLYFD
jgi:DNA-directed RNA polymerase subunit RPC12/RpoP